MSIDRIDELKGQPSRISVNGANVLLRASDASPTRRPRLDRYTHEEKIYQYKVAGEDTQKLWKHKIANYLLCMLDIMPNNNATDYVLTRFPTHYELYTHEAFTGDDDSNPRIDNYLHGSEYVKCFRSPEEFAPHAKWLAYNCPLDDNGKPLCGCKYCSKRPQAEITAYLKEISGADMDELQERPRPLSKAKGHAKKEDEIIVHPGKDYRLLNNVDLSVEPEPELLTMPIKEEVKEEIID